MTCPRWRPRDAQRPLPRRLQEPAIVIAGADRAEQVVAAAPGVDGRVRIEVTLRAAADSDAAKATVRNLRDAVHAVPGSRSYSPGASARWKTLLAIRHSPSSRSSTKLSVNTLAPWLSVIVAVATVPCRRTWSMRRRRVASSSAGRPVNTLQYSSSVQDTSRPSRRPSMCAVGQKARR